MLTNNKNFKVITKMKKSFKKVRSVFSLGCVVCALLFSAGFVSCSHDDDGSTAQDFDISSLYGYTFQGTISASSGGTLTPALILYNSYRCDWNMSTSSMENNKFYYFAEKTGTASYSLYWYGGSKSKYCTLEDKTQADMVIQLGIDSENKITILLTGDSLTGVSGMTNTRVPMTKTSAEKNTSAPEIVVDSSIKDVTITIPETAVSADWSEDETTFEGSFVYLVGENGSMAKAKGRCDENDTITPSVKIAKGESGKVSVTTPQMWYSSSMQITPYEVEDVSLSQDGDIYYLNKENFSQTLSNEDGSTTTLNIVSLKGKYENSVLTLRIEFKPGKMPFAITQIFSSN